MVAVCQSTPSDVDGAKDTNRAAWTCAGNGSSYTLPMGWYTSLNSPPRAADVCSGVTCRATSWECHQPSSYFSSSSLTQPSDVVGTKNCCVVNPSSESWTASGQTTLTSKPAASSVCSGITYTGRNNCDSLGTVMGTRAASHRWSINVGDDPDQTARPVATEYCPEVTWTDSAVCATAYAPIVGTKNCPPEEDYQWSLGVQNGAPVVLDCPNDPAFPSLTEESRTLLGTFGLGACYSPGEVNNYQSVTPWLCTEVQENMDLEDRQGKALLWMTQTSVPVQ